MGAVLYNILIKPLELFIEIVFNVMNLTFRNLGVAIIFVSIAVQLLCFPLYKRADAIQEQERQKQKKMKPWLDHIKNTFKGDERFMIQQAYYKLADYKPIYAIKGSVSLLLQIPFFIAAYNFLSNLDALKHASFLGIADLSQPDQLIPIGTLTLNLLPILMTLFNIISAIVYTKGFPLKDKIQTYGLAVIFLVLLYKSPSGLVFYWTLNNLFSLFKNVFKKTVKNPKKVITVFLLIIGIIIPVYAIFISNRATIFKVLSVIVAVICILPSIISRFKSKTIKNPETKTSRYNIKQINTVFYLSISVVFLILALVIPVSVIKSSPVEFISDNYGPFGLLINVASIYIGYIFVWINIFYIFSSEKIRYVFACLSCIAAIVFPVNYFFFGKHLGIVSPYLIYDRSPSFSASQIVVNSAVVGIISVIAFVVFYKKSEVIKVFYKIAVVAFAVTAVIGMVSIEKNLAEEGHPEKNISEASDLSKNESLIKLSKNGKNVVIIILDRAISGYVPYFIEEKPEFKNSFDGFTYYPNTLSFGGSTNLGSPALYGGYEYTPTEMNKRENETLESKHNEALTVMPRLFLENNYNVTVFDPPLAGYKYIPDLSIYDEYEGINAYNLTGKYSDEYSDKYSSLYEVSQMRNFVFFSLMRSLPVVAHNTIYQNGVYWSTGEVISFISAFLDSYSVLERLEKLTDISDGSKNTFMMMHNDTTHEPILLEEPDYTPAVDVSIPAYNSKTTSDGKTVNLSTQDNVSHYQANFASLLRIGEWLNYLKKEGVYNNTRIIIASDHGRDMGQFDYMKLNNGIDVEEYNPLLLVKDFDSTGFKISDEFMTNADVPSMAVEDIVDNSVNLFTGKALDGSEKQLHSQIITTSDHFAITTYHGNVYDTSDGEWWSVSNNIFDEKNWKKVEVN